jgi:two-component system, cell cycle sensor histidine kinase and response regulator CckA
VGHDDADRYRRMFDAAAVGLLLIDESGVVTLANPAAGAMFGLTPGYIVGKPALDTMGRFLVPADLEHVKRRMVERASVPASYQVRVIRADGRQAVCQVYGNPLYDEHGEFEGSVAVLIDVTDAVATDAALRFSERRLQLIAEQLPAVVSTTDTDLRLTSSTGAGLARLGLKTNQSVGITIQEFVAAGGDPDNPIVGHLRDALAGNDVTWEGVWAGHTYLMNARPLRDEADEIIGTVYLGLDITPQKEAEADRSRLQDELRQAQKMEAVGRLASGIAHDFNNVLTAIGTYADFLSLGLSDRQDLEDVEGIRHEVDRAASRTRQLLAFARRQVLDRRTLDLNDIVADMDRLLRRLIGEDIELVTILDPDLGAIEADRSQIEQVIVNLALNARDAMPSGGKLVLETGELVVREELIDARLSLAAGRYVTLAVRDTGTGMDAETLNHIFEPFFTTKDVGLGTGLGLSTSLNILEQSGAQISVYSEQFRGSTFKIFFERSADLAPHIAYVDESGPPPSGSETVLLVEDDDVLRSLTARAFRSNGYDVVEARYVSEAAERLAEMADGIQLVVTDVVMPGMSGAAFADELAEQYPDLLVVLMSGFSDRPELPPSGTTTRRFIEKPFTQRQLLVVVRELLDAPDAD